MLVVTVAVAGRRIAWLVKLIRSGKPDKTRLEGIQQRAKDQLVEVFGQKQAAQVERRRASRTSSRSGASSSWG